MREPDAPSDFLTLTRVARCLRCEECFEEGPALCPACGSKACARLTPILTRARRRSAAVYVEDPVTLAA